jgi:hypothetical protein
MYQMFAHLLKSCLVQLNGWRYSRSGADRGWHYVCFQDPGGDWRSASALGSSCEIVDSEVRSGTCVGGSKTSDQKGMS